MLVLPFEAKISERPSVTPCKYNVDHMEAHRHGGATLLPLYLLCTSWVMIRVRKCRVERGS